MVFVVGDVEKGLLLLVLLLVEVREIGGLLVVEEEVEVVLVKEKRLRLLLGLDLLRGMAGWIWWWEVVGYGQ